MYKYLTILVLILVISLYFVNFVFSSEPTRKIVVFQTAVNEAAKDELIKRVEGVKLKNLDLIEARAVWLPNKAAVEKLASDPRVLRIDDDVVVEALGQTLTWNIDQVDAELVWPTGNTADPVKVGVLDTGISNRHLKRVFYC